MDPSNTLIDTTITQTPLNIATTDATLTTAGTTTTNAATTTTAIPVENVADETTRRSLFGADLYQTCSVEGTTSALVAVPALSPILADPQGKSRILAFLYLRKLTV